MCIVPISLSSPEILLSLLLLLLLLLLLSPLSPPESFFRSGLGREDGSKKGDAQNGRRSQYLQSVQHRSKYRRDRYVPRETAQNAHTIHTRPPHLRPRCHRQPATNLGYRLYTPSRYVPRSRYHRSTRYAAGLLPRPRRMPRLPLDLRPQATRTYLKIA